MSLMCDIYHTYITTDNTSQVRVMPLLVFVLYLSLMNQARRIYLFLNFKYVKSSFFSKKKRCNIFGRFYFQVKEVLQI